MAKQKKSEPKHEKETAPLTPPAKVKFRQRDWNFTHKQVDILKVMMDENTKVVFLNGPAGTSKTILAVYAALCMLDRGGADQIIYIRTVIESASKSLGFLPGSESEKLSPFMMPLLDKCEELLSPDSVKGLTENEKLIGMPVNFLRGASWRNKIVITDESQNFCGKELTTVMTRIGKNTKLFVVGDTMQSDINGNSGFADFLKAFSTQECEDRGIYFFEFTKEDIMRSEILKFIVAKIEEITAKKKEKAERKERLEHKEETTWVPRLKESPHDKS